MAVRSKEELLTAIRDRIGDSTDDEDIALVEDVSDTLAEYEKKLTDTTDWEQKYLDNDAKWRKKYRDRFFSDINNDDKEVEHAVEKQAYKFEDLFEEVK